MIIFSFLFIILTIIFVFFCFRKLIFLISTDRSWSDYKLLLLFLFLQFLLSLFFWGNIWQFLECFSFLRTIIFLFIFLKFFILLFEFLIFLSFWGFASFSHFLTSSNISFFSPNISFFFVFFYIRFNLFFLDILWNALI